MQINPGRMLTVVCTVLLLPVALYEYFILLWFWGGGDLFNFVTVPILYVILIILQSALLKKYKENKLISILGFFSKVFITPLLTIVIFIILGKIFNINIQIV